VERARQPVRVPFVGHVGDSQARQVLTPTANGFPWLGGSTGSSDSKQADGAVYSMADAQNVPLLNSTEP
jgi:hypothetical protein